jgi:hypothetical protein
LESQPVLRTSRKQAGEETHPLLGTTVVSETSFCLLKRSRRMDANAQISIAVRAEITESRARQFTASFSKAGLIGT